MKMTEDKLKLWFAYLVLGLGYIVLVLFVLALICAVSTMIYSIITDSAALRIVVTAVLLILSVIFGINLFDWARNYIIDVQIMHK